MLPLYYLAPQGLNLLNQARASTLNSEADNSSKENNQKNNADLISHKLLALNKKREELEKNRQKRTKKYMNDMSLARQAADKALSQVMSEWSNNVNNLSSVFCQQIIEISQTLSQIESESALLRLNLNLMLKQQQTQFAMAQQMGLLNAAAVVAGRNTPKTNQHFSSAAKRNLSEMNDTSFDTGHSNKKRKIILRPTFGEDKSSMPSLEKDGAESSVEILQTPSPQRQSNITMNADTKAAEQVIIKKNELVKRKMLPRQRRALLKIRGGNHNQTKPSRAKSMEPPLQSRKLKLANEREKLRILKEHSQRLSQSFRASMLRRKNQRILGIGDRLLLRPFALHDESKDSSRLHSEEEDKKVQS